MGIPLKAYSAADDDGSVIVFGSRNNWALRVDAASSLHHGDASAITRVERSPMFDRYAPGPVPISALLEAGWWHTCAGCARKVVLAFEEEGVPTCEPAYHLYHPDSVWCTPNCRESDLQARYDRMLKDVQDYTRLSEKALARWPGIVIHSVSPAHRHKQPGLLTVNFRVPGWTGYGCISWTEGEDSISVPTANIDEWNRFIGDLKAGVDPKDDVAGD